ncbi:MAG: GAF domain-containing protein [Candidatus Bathyarchaeia archaeon]
MNEKQIEEISKLYYLLRKAPDLSLGLDIILESALNTLDMDIGALLIINDKEKVIKMRSFKSKIKKLELPESYALNGEFIELKALRMNSPTSEILKNPELSILKMNSIHCVPIHIGKEVSGVLSIGSQKDLTLNSIEIGI